MADKLNETKTGRTMNDLMNRISNPACKERDLLIDELNDLIVYGQVNPTDLESIVKQLMNQLRHEADPAVNESIFHLLATVFDNGDFQHLIADETAKLLNQLPAACLVYAIPIIAYSHRSDKPDLLQPFIHDKDDDVRMMIAEILKHSNK
ncbi:hypothetical protein [Undibacterium sp. TS12]|uniref:hypothetical protein n=1 Tax=Undibacterium sp. TS12 TaxID=2908202 RepID=UPI001F4C6AB3|nr:hypothetical protein [Undibacterium sp. TS12]MCH8622515.1 hypothetical protein [Undibacterium sp. TS12]